MNSKNIQIKDKNISIWLEYQILKKCSSNFFILTDAKNKFINI